jgi:hypothetical protein
MFSVFGEPNDPFGGRTDELERQRCPVGAPCHRPTIIDAIRPAIEWMEQTMSVMSSV